VNAGNIIASVCINGNERGLHLDYVVAVTEGRLDFGTREQIFYYEFGGRCRKHMLVKIIGKLIIKNKRKLIMINLRERKSRWSS
jgi:hypothetical protein